MTGPGLQNEFAKKASTMKIPSYYDNKDYGKKVKAVPRKVSIVSSGTGKFYGARTIMTKETFAQFLNKEELVEQPIETVDADCDKEHIEESTMTFADYLVEGDDITTLPDTVLGEIKSNIRSGAKDVAQKWKNALELVHKAYQVANVRRPTPSQKGAWKQYEQMIQFGVRQLTDTRGIDGDWRMSNVLIREQKEVDQKMGKRRFFAEIDGHPATEVDGKDMGEIIEQMTNKFRRHSSSVRVEHRSDHGAILSIWKDGVQIDKMIIKEL